MGKRIKLEDLIEAEIIKPKLTEAASCFLRANAALSMAGGIVRAMVSGKPNDGMPYRRVNGWTFW